jgi:glutaredoxin-like protein
MALMDERVRTQVRSALADLPRPVKLLMFTQGEGGALECDYCGDTRQLLEELAGLSGKLTLDVRDFQRDEPDAKTYGIDKIPAVALLADGDAPKDYGIRLYGVPAGYEFSSLIESIRLVSRGNAGLSADTLQKIAQIKQPVHIQVFVTPT